MGTFRYDLQLIRSNSASLYIGTYTLSLNKGGTTNVFASKIHHHVGTESISKASNVTTFTFSKRGLSALSFSSPYPVPEPASIALLGAGIAAFRGRRART